jgi:hypothetical protein
MKPNLDERGARGAADGRGAIMGAVTSEVSQVTLEMADGRMLSAIPRSVAGGGAAARLFIVREPFVLGRDPAVRALVFYGRNGERLERFPIG